jgi:MFS family permease
MGLAVLLLVEAGTGSLAAAGVAAGALSLGVGLTRPLQGRLIDRSGSRVVLAVCLLHAAAAGALLAAEQGGAGGRGLAALAFAVGFTSPALSVITRTVVTLRLPPARQPALLGADNALQDVAFVAGPLIAGAIAALGSPASAVLVLLAIGCAGASATAAVAPLGPRRAGGPRLARPVLRPIARPLVQSAGQGAVYGALGVSAVAAVLADGADHLAGPATAAIFAGGLLGDLVLAPRRADAPLAARLRARTLALLALAALVAGTPALPLLLAGLVACGAALATVGVTLLVDVAGRAGERSRAEAFGWAGASLRLGDAVGAAAAGVLAEEVGARAGLLVAVAGAGLALAAVLAPSGRRPVHPPRPVSYGTAWAPSTGSPPRPRGGTATPSPASR